MFAAYKGMNVVLGASSMLTRYGFSDLPPGVILLKTFNAIDSEIMRAAIGKGHLVAVIDEEAVGRASAENVYRFNVDPQAAAFADLILTQGEAQQEIMKKIYPETAKKMRLTGNPKADIFQLKFSEPDTEPKRDGPILVCLMSGNINPNARSFAECAASTLSLSGTPASSDTGRDFVAPFKNCVSFEIAMVPQIADAVHAVAVGFPDRKIVVRPHPVESPGLWNNAFSNLPNGSVRPDGALTDWLGDAAALIYISGSTSGLEGYLSGIATIRFVRDGRACDPANSFSSYINSPARTGEEMVESLKLFMNRGAAAAAKDADAKVVARFLYQPADGLVSAGIADELLSLHRAHCAAGKAPLEALQNYNERRPEPFKPLEFHLGKFPDMNTEDFSTRLHSFASRAGVTQTFDVEKVEFNTFLIRAA